MAVAFDVLENTSSTTVVVAAVVGKSNQRHDVQATDVLVQKALRWMRCSVLAWSVDLALALHIHLLGLQIYTREGMDPVPLH